MKQLCYPEGVSTVDEIRKNTGNFNDLPFGWQELTEEQFVKANYAFSDARFIEYRQMRPEAEGAVMVLATLFHITTNEGFAIGTDFWKGKVKYYAFGCDHNWETLSSEQCREKGIPHFGMCWHVNCCSKCGATQSHDSSD